MSEKKVAGLKIERAVLIDQQERMNEFLDTSSNTASLAVLELRLDHVEKQMIHFLALQSQIEKLDETELTQSTRASYEEKLKQDHEQSQSSNDLSLAKGNIRLPKINLPIFSGDVTQWTNFYESFKILIHEEQSLSNLHKYQYLKSTLTGSAAAQISALELTEENYDVALTLLKNKYGDKRVICQAHIENLLHIKPLSANKPEYIKSFVDNVNVQLRALEALGRPVKQWDDVLVYLTLQRLDAAWEDKAPESRLPTLQELLTFLTKKSEKIEITRKSQATSTAISAIRAQKPTKMALISSNQRHCSVCNMNGHAINKCCKFINMSLADRVNKVKELKLCSNCLKVHTEHSCRSPYSCQICKGRHHTLLHNSNSKARDNASVYRTQPSTSNEGNKFSLHSKQHSSNTTSDYVFMPTVIVNVKDARGYLTPCRAILDSASQLSFVSERLVQRLGMKKRRTLATISGIGDNLTVNSNYKTQLNIFSRHSNFSSELTAMILSNITAFQPSFIVKTSTWNIPKNIHLSDPEFFKPNRIDLLIGAELHFQLLQVGQISLGENLHILQKTTLGWVVAGKSLANCQPKYSCNLASTTINENDNESLSLILQRFWELEGHVSAAPKNSQEEILCETHFKETYKRDSSGRITEDFLFCEIQVA